LEKEKPNAMEMAEENTEKSKAKTKAT